MLKQCVQKRLLLVLLAILAAGLQVPDANAQTSVEQKAIDRAHAFLGNNGCGKNVLSFVHFGAQYKGHEYLETRSVLNQRGHFALVYRFDWENDGTTRLAFLCDKQGGVYQVQVLSTNAVFQQPYALANASIKIVGNALLEAFRDQLSNEDAAQMRQLIDNTNARGLLEMSLRLQQALAK